jgi:O-antigen/teichoic acid export membrane protein
MGQLFFQVSSDCYKNDTPATEAFLSTLKKLVVIALPVFTLLFFTIEDISAFVFGEQWRIAGYYAKLLLPLYFIRTIYIPLSPITNAFEKLELALKIHVAIFSGNILSFIIAYFAGFSIKNFLITYCIIGSIIYTLMGYILFLVASKRIK